MIKQFEITNIRKEEDGSNTVFFSVSRTGHTDEGEITRTYTSTMTVPEGQDIDETVYNNLANAGWIA